MSTAFSFSRDIDVAMPQQAFGGQADVLADIYAPQINMAVWQRPLAEIRATCGKARHKYWAYT